MRLFVAVWPAPAVLDVLEGLPRRDDPVVRWTARDQWHVTLRFLGDVDDGVVAGVVDGATAAAARCAPRPVDLGPATRRYGRNALGVPVAGLDDLAGAMSDATAGIGRPSEHREFRGHLTVARSRGRQPIPRSYEGIECAAGWMATELAVVRSHLGAGPASYETLATLPLGDAHSAGGYQNKR